MRPILLQTLLLCLVAADHPRLTVAASSVFKIAIPSDLHFGELPDAYGPWQDRDSAHFLRRMLRTERPDLVILNGDLITGEDTLAQDPTKSLEVLLAPMLEAKVPWASTYGNHDSKYNLTREALLEAETKYPLSLTQRGPQGTDGVTNYFFLLYNVPAAEPVVILWFLDSRGGSSNRTDNVDNTPNWVSNATTTWFLQKSAELDAQYANLEHIVFTHIPPYPFYDAQSQFLDPATSPSWRGDVLFPGSYGDSPLAIQGESTYSNNTYSDQDVAFVDALLARNVHSIWSGHDHEASWCTTFPNEHDDGDDHETVMKQADINRGGRDARKRPFLCLCKHTGIGGYGTWQRGIRMMSLQSDARGRLAVETWIRMHDGSAVTRVSLNETYGSDTYPRFSEDDHGSEFLWHIRAAAQNDVVL